MASLYSTPRSDQRQAETEWRSNSRSRIDFDNELDRMPRWAACTVIFAIGLILWSLVFGAGTFICGLLP